jgi:hypothetical protein
MNTDKSKSRFFICVCVCSSVVLTLFSGCSTPSAANIQLRKNIDDLQTQIQNLKRQQDADQATIRGLKGATTVPTLSEERIDELFTTHGLKFGRITGGDDQGLKISVCPTDDQGQALKAAGSFQIDAFDLAKAHDNDVGHWNFDVQQARDAWLGQAMMYAYVLKCPWQKRPEHEQLTIRVTFTDALTGRVFTEQKEVRVKLSPTSQP